MGCVEDGKLSDGKTVSTCNHAMAVVGFHTKRGEQVNVQVASSFISDEQALRNLKEVEGKTFDEVKSEGRKEWNNILGRKTTISTIFARFIVASIAPYCSHARSMNSTNRVILSTTVLITAKYYQVTSLLTQASGIPSVRSSHCLTSSIRQ